MNIPKDSVMLLSYVNTQLRNFYPSLEELCSVIGISSEEIKNKLSIIGYEYDDESNCFK